MPDLSTGAVFAGHRIEGIAGRGGMGVVYRATHLVLDHVVALKVISPELAGDPRFRRRFESESRIAVSIRHPNVVAVHHAGEEEGLLFVTMDFVEGTDLRGLLDERTRLEPEHAVAILTEVASALDAAHAKGLVHRDIKPGNILIGRRDSFEQVYLSDFGLTKQIEATSGITQTGAFVGTLDYVAPEQIRGERVDARADVYALGCVLFEALTGTAPFADRTEKVAKMYAHLQDEAPFARQLNPASNRELDGIVRRAMAKDPAARFPSAGDLARAAMAAVAGEPTVESERSVATGAAAPVVAAPTEPAPAPAPDPATALPTEPATAPTPLAPEPSGEVESPTVHAQSAEAERRIEAAEPPVRRAPPPVPPRREMRGLLLGALGLLVVAAIAVVLLSGGGGDEAPSEAARSGAGTQGNGGAAAGGGGGEGAGGASEAEVAGEPVAVGDLPVGIAHGDGVWVANRAGGTVTPIDTERFRALPAIDMGGAPEGIAVDEGSVWVSVRGRNQLVELDAASREEAGAVGVGLDPGGVAIGFGSAWVANEGSDDVTRVELGSGATDTVTVGDRPYGVAVGAKAVWVTNRGDGTVSRIDPGAATAGEPIEVGANPKGITASRQGVWVANTDAGTVSRIDHITDDAEAPIEVGAEPRALVDAFGSIWVASGDGSVTRLSPDGDKQQTLEDVGESPEGLTAGPNFLYVSNGVGDSVTRIAPGG